MLKIHVAWAKAGKEQGNFEPEILASAIKTSYHLGMLSSAIGRLRIISIMDGLSFLYLLYHSIYSKRMLGMDEAIRVPGIIHGVLFTIFCFVLLDAMLKQKWSLKPPVLIFISSLIPLAPIFVEIWLKKQKPLEE